jgi:dephospho-CoA kinase
MFHVGLTGNVASGKSMVARLFDAWGATVIDADRLTRNLQRPNSPTLDAIARRFGTEFVAPDGALDREALRRHVMAHDSARAALNAIVHPAVQAARAQLLTAAQDRGDLIVVSVIPLLFEVLDPAEFDTVVLVDASETTRRRRLVELRRLPAEDADQLLAAQHPSAPKRARSHVVIDNDGSLADLERAAWDTWRALRTRAARASADDAGALVTVVAHPADAAHVVGGTLARYADAGHDIHVVSATDPFPTTAVDVKHTALGRTVGHVDPDDTSAIYAVATVLRERSPNIVITLDSESFGQHADHVAVHGWTTRAIAHAGVSARLVGAVRDRPDDVARGAIAVDVRPWRDITLQLAAAVSGPCDVALLRDPSPDYVGRERFVAYDGRPHRAWDFSDPAQRG